MTEIQRLEAANEFIKVIASCGRNFFSENSDMRNKKDKPFTSFMEVDARGKVWFTDYYTRKRIYTHYRYDWNGFTSGGTLRDIVICLRNFIKKGSQMRAAYFEPREIFGDMEHPWGYGGDLRTVKEAAVRLGIAA